MNCVSCGERTSRDTAMIKAGRARRRSTMNPNRCVACAGTRIYGHSNQHQRYVEPRYCTCTGDVPPPDANGGCPDCHRLVEAFCRCGQSSNT